MEAEKKGHVKITVEIEVNEALMDLAKESSKGWMEAMREMPWHRKKEEEK